ncbi:MULTISPECIES: hypothetical protein [Pseudomonas syringae group]|uniref:hypothetical protein n=1 Tax=Pseudomonas syringae group TaxID=136849 RepID=UPI000EFFCA81|nr:MULTISPECIES: hypothetical protein [Pseudomonas syringae group]MDH4602361.1 hypothetical protein [Pseudomonas syringae pv. papulans]
MKASKLILLCIGLTAAISSTGCSTVSQLEANAIADRSANPEKYREDPAVLRQQLTANQSGFAYPEFCTFGCPDEPMNLMRPW